MKLCACCAPTEYPSGKVTDFNGKWHNKFKRLVLPMGEFFTNKVGNLEHKETGLLCTEFAEKYPERCEYEQPN